MVSRVGSGAEICFQTRNSGYHANMVGFNSADDQKQLKEFKPKGNTINRILVRDVCKQER